MTKVNSGKVILNSNVMEDKTMLNKKVIEGIVKERTEARKGEGAYVEASESVLKQLAGYIVDCEFDYSIIGDYSFSEELYDVVNYMSDNEKRIFWGEIESLVGYDSYAIDDIIVAVEDYIRDCDDYIDVLDYTDAGKYDSNVSSWYIIERFSEVAHNFFADMADSYYGVNPIVFLNTCLAHTTKVILAKLVEGECDLNDYLSEDLFDVLVKYSSLLTSDFAVLCILNYHDCGWAILAEKIAESLN